MKLVSLTFIIISSLSTPTLPHVLHYSCSKEYSLESILYPSCIPAMCGVVTRQQFIPSAMVESMMVEIHSLTGHQHKVFTAMDLHTHTMVREGITHKIENMEDYKLTQLLAPVVDKVEMLVRDQFSSSTMQLTFPLVVSVISPGPTPVPYTNPHVDLYSYQATAPHVTAVLYLAGLAAGGS